MSNLRDDLVSYCGDVINDRIVGCEKHKWACIRFLNDIEAEDTDRFPYVFYEDSAERFFRWMRLFKHSKGILSGKHIEPDIIQKFVYGNIYGWKHRETGYRRFTKFYWQVARKNAKSQGLSAMSSYELMAFDETGSETMEVYCAATKTAQAKIVFDETLVMLEKCDLLKGKWSHKYGEIKHKNSGSVMRPLSKDDKKTGDGLNPQFGVIDEYHAHPTSEIYDIIETGQGARSQPLLGIITTAGFDLNNPCYAVEYNLVSKILDPDNPVRLDSYFAMVNELETNRTSETLEIDGRKVPPGDLIDDPFDEKNWPKANPIICSYPEGWADLRKKAAEAQISPEKMGNFKTKRLNVWVNENEASYINTERYAACAVPRHEFPSVVGAEVCVGLDLSAKNDITSFGIEGRLGEKYFCFSHSFIPESKLAPGKTDDLVDYRLWRRQGWLTITEGEVVDYRRVIETAREKISELGVYAREWCIDPWGAVKVSSDLIDEGETVVEIVQGIKTLSEPTKDFKNQILQRNIIHDGSPVFMWALGNACVSIVDRNENILLNKAKSRGRIDPVVAMINAHTRVMCMEPERAPKVRFF